MFAGGAKITVTPVICPVDQQQQQQQQRVAGLLLSSGACSRYWCPSCGAACRQRHGSEPRNEAQDGLDNQMRQTHD